MLEEIFKMPKIELHVHLDGSVDLALASKLSGLSIDEVKTKMVANDKCADLNEYLTKFDFPISLMQSKENLELVAKHLADNLYNQNVIYAEVRFAPAFHTKNGLSIDEVIEAVLHGIKKVPIKINLILCLMRGMSYEANLKTLEIAKKHLNKGVCAVDLAGAEAVYPTEGYHNLFELASEQNIPFTVHAGEADGPDSIKAALNFGAKRIGHGIRCIEDDELLNRIVNEKILLEVCPTSNVQTNVVGEYDKHPISKLYNAGVHICINTDNVTVSNVSLTDEYMKLVNNFNLTLDDLKKMNLYALQGSFISQKEKDEISKRF